MPTMPNVTANWVVIDPTTIINTKSFPIDKYLE